MANLIRQSRAAIWAAVFVLWIEAFISEPLFGHSSGLLTFLAIIALSIGLLTFIAGLSLDGSVWPFPSRVPGADAFPGTREAVVGESSSQSGDRGTLLEREPFVGTTVAAETRAAAMETRAGPPGVEQNALAGPEVPLEPPAGDPRTAAGYPEPARGAEGPERAIPPRRGGVRTQRVPAESDLLRTVCLSCQQPVKAGQLVAECFVCGAAHHATCWMENRFHCARQGCDGHGALEEPDPS